MTDLITPPPELIDQWVTEACPECHLTYDEFTGESVQSLVTIAVRWGADQQLKLDAEQIAQAYQAGAARGELKACFKYLHLQRLDRAAEMLSAARRRPGWRRRLKEQALDQLRRVNAVLQFQADGGETSVIRRALEALPND